MRAFFRSSWSSRIVGPAKRPGLAILLPLLFAQAAAFAPTVALCMADETAIESDTADERFIVIKAGKIITISGKEIDGGMIVVSGGKIENVGRNLEYPRNAKVIDARDSVVMPGLILPHTRAGLPDYSRRGVHGDLTVEQEFRTRDGQFDDLLDAGFTMAGIVPAGSDIPGRALLTHTAGKEGDRVVTSPAYVRIAASAKELREALKKAKAEIEKVAKAKKEHEDKLKQQAEQAAKKQEQTPPKPKDEGRGAPDKAEPPASQPASQPTSQPASQPAFKAPQIDPKYQVLVDLIQEKEGVRALVECDSASDYLQFAMIFEEYKIAFDWRFSNTRQSDLAEIVEKLGESKPRVVLWAERHRVPYSAERLPLIQQFERAGCQVTLMPRGDNAHEYAQFLPRLAELVRDGWSRESALASITTNPAVLLGVDNRFGTIEKDKQADLIFLDADPLAPGARVRKVMIAGEVVHTVEYDKQ
jgi:hypothetical protein